MFAFNGERRDTMVSFLLLTWSAVLATVCRASPVHSTGSTPPPLPPSRDPFYTAPGGYQHAAPGEILRVRKAPGNLTSVIQNCSVAYNILYRTTDSHYQPSWAVTTLFAPQKPTEGSAEAKSTGHGSVLLSYQIPYDTADVDGSPSYALYSGGQPDIPVALGLGWFVNVPDYEGPLASFTAGVQSGHATIDSVRAVLSSGLGGLSPHGARYALWGYSGGALASEWAAELQVQYAPELNFIGAALGGLTPNITNVFTTVNETPISYFIPPAVMGLASQYPAVYQYVIQELKASGPYNKTGFLAAKSLTLDEAAYVYASQDIYQYFTDGSAILQAPLVKQAIDADGIMGYHGVPQMPLFVYKAIADEVSPIEDTDALVAKYCNIGANILYQRNSVGGHIAEEINGDQMAFEWLYSALTGTLQQTGCLVQNVTVSVTSSPY